MRQRENPNTVDCITYINNYIKSKWIKHPIKRSERQERLIYICCVRNLLIKEERQVNSKVLEKYILHHNKKIAVQRTLTEIS